MTEHTRPPEPRRRSSDRVPADVKLYVSDEVGETRHILRGEMAEAMLRLDGTLVSIRQNMETDNLARVTERAEIKAAVSDIKDDVSRLTGIVDRLEPRVQRLEAGAVAADQVQNFKRWLIATGCAVVAVVVTATGVLLASIH